ncbi:MAG TPA: aminoglycoside phosphotransferase family protein, partial [Acidimicrobiales bacterium]|nr:aminoglycoside phosphotransferase family protein [Acidimicrobiales bacterium]
MADPRVPGDLPVVVEQARRPEGQRWLAALPGLLDAAAERWNLSIGVPFPGGSAAWAGPVRRPDGTEAVLKVTLPHREARHEGEGLRTWDGNGAVFVYEEDPLSYTLLIERCRPGTELKYDPAPAEDRLAVASQLLTRLWQQPFSDRAAFETVDDVCGDWAELVRRRMDELKPPFDPGLVALGAHLLEALPASATRRVLVHGDFNPTNILRAEREPWLAIDAKPMVGDPGYDVMPLASEIDSRLATHPVPEALRRHFELVASIVAEPSERLLAWAAARTVEAALWHSSLGEHVEGLEAMQWARVF